MVNLRSLNGRGYSIGIKWFRAVPERGVGTHAAALRGERTGAASSIPAYAGMTLGGAVGLQIRLSRLAIPYVLVPRGYRRRIQGVEWRGKGVVRRGTGLMGLLLRVGNGGPPRSAPPEWPGCISPGWWLAVAHRRLCCCCHRGRRRSSRFPPRPAGRRGLPLRCSGTSRSPMGKLPHPEVGFDLLVTVSPRSTLDGSLGRIRLG